MNSWERLQQTPETKCRRKQVQKMVVCWCLSRLHINGGASATGNAAGVLMF